VKKIWKSPALKAAGFAVCVASLVSGCSLFSSSTAPKIAPLETLDGKVAGKVVWQARTDDVLFPLAMVVRGEQLVTATSSGQVSAFSAANGQLQWRNDLHDKLAAGVGSDGRYAAVVTRNNELVAMDGAKTLWRKSLAVPVVTAPLVAGERVFVLTVDREVLAFDVIDGRKLWDLRRPGDALTLLESGVIGAYKDTLVVGQGARMAGVDPLRGTLRWEANVATPRGTNEVERLADLVAPLMRADEMLCARSFQAAVGCVNAERGSTTWTRNVGGLAGLGGNKELVVGGDASDRLTAWKTSNGDVLWTAEQFLNRKLSAPAVLNHHVVVADGEGMVHFLSDKTGKTEWRVATDGSAIMAAPVVVGDKVVVATRNGGVFAIHID